MHDHSDEPSVARPRRRDLLVGGGALAAAAGVAAAGLAQPASAATPLLAPVYAPINPYRYYDTRDGDGPVPAGFVATITPESPFDSSILALCFNLTVVNTVSSGFMAAFPDDSGWLGNSSVNWYASNQIVANSVFTGFGPDGGVSFLAGINQTDFLLDVVAVSALVDISSPTGTSAASVRSWSLPTGVQAGRTAHS